MNSLTVRIVAQLGLSVLLLGCGGGGAGTAPKDPGGEATTAPGEPAMDPEQAAALERLRARQAEVCDDLCVRLNDCVRKDAEENNPEVLGNQDGVTGEQLLDKHKSVCVDECNNSGIMTPEQRKTLVEQCFPIEDCQAFAECAGDALTK